MFRKPGAKTLTKFGEWPHRDTRELTEFKYAISLHADPPPARALGRLTGLARFLDLEVVLRGRCRRLCPRGPSHGSGRP